MVAQRSVRSTVVRLGLLCALLALLVLPTARPARANTTYQTLPFTQNWSNTSLISANDDWSGVPGIVGYRGDGLTGSTGTDPQTVLTEGTPVIDVNANQTNPATFTTGGVTEFEITDPVVALSGSGTATAPNIVLYLNTTGQSGITVSYNVRDIDSSTDNAVQPVALQYRVGSSGNFTNVPAGFVPDATTGPSLATLVTAVSAVLPADADNQPQLQVRIITTNAVGNDEAVGIDDISVTGGGVVNGAVVPTCPANLTTVVGTPTSGNISATDSDGTVTQASITSGAVAGITLDSVTPAGSVGGQLTATLNVADSVAAGSYPVVISFANSDATPQTATCTVTVKVNPVGGACPTTPANLKATYEIQGTTDTSPLSGQTVSVRGVVVGDFQGSSALSGFFIQDQTGDANPATSDGLFVYEGASSLGTVSVGDLVQVAGTVSEFNGLTELGTLTKLESCGTAAVPAPVDLTLPVASTTTLEGYEGMLVRFQQTLTVDQNYFLGRYGQVTLSSDGRLFNPTNGNFASDTLDLNTRRMLVLDDGSSKQNPNPTPYFAADNTLRAGDTTPGLTGLLDYGPINSNTAIRHYRLHPTVAPTFTRVNQRTAAPAAVGGNVKVASFNVLNYFSTINQTGAKCFPSNSASDCRGANTAEEFTRQQAKIVKAITAIDPDVAGLIELENNGATAIGSLVAALNAATAPGTYAAVPDPASGTGSDAIKVGMIYKPGRVQLVGASLSDTDSINNRPPLAQTFRLASNNEKFSVVVNHFKSKGSCPSGSSDPDADYGQGCWNARRTAQAQRLLTFLNTVKTQAGDPDMLVIGDLNAYGKEDPVNTLVAGGLVNQAERFIPAADRYSYVFDGAAGELDHVLATGSLSSQASNMTIWHINADEPSVLDYNTEFKQPDCPTCGPDYYSNTPYRASDHDPAVIGLQLQGTPLAPASLAGSSVTVNKTSVAVGEQVVYTVTISNSGQVAASYVLTDTLPAGVAAVAGPGVTVNGQTVTASGNVAGGQQVTVQITVQVNQAIGTLNNQIALSGDGQTHTLTAPAVAVSQPVDPTRRIYLPIAKKS